MASNDLQHSQSNQALLQQVRGGAPDFIRAWGEINRVFDQMTAGFDQMASGFGVPTLRRLSALSGLSGRHNPETSLPILEVTENENDYRVLVELPGIDPKDVDVSIDNNILNIRAERRQHDEKHHDERQRNVYISERVYGVIQRSLQLNNDVDRDGVKADYRNGLLTLALPKSQQARQQRRKIEIQG